MIWYVGSRGAVGNGYWTLNYSNGDCVRNLGLILWISDIRYAHLQANKYLPSSAASSGECLPPKTGSHKPS